MIKSNILQYQNIAHVISNFCNVVNILYKSVHYGVNLAIIEDRQKLHVWVYDKGANGAPQVDLLVLDVVVPVNNLLSGIGSWTLQGPSICILAAIKQVFESKCHSPLLDSAVLQVYLIWKIDTQFQSALKDTVTVVSEWNWIKHVICTKRANFTMLFYYIKMPAQSRKQKSTLPLTGARASYKVGRRYIFWRGRH